MVFYEHNRYIYIVYISNLYGYLVLNLIFLVPVYSSIISMTMLVEEQL